MFKRLLIVWLTLFTPILAVAQDVGSGFETLYRVTLLRADPGQFSKLLNDVKGRAARRDTYHVLRHTQGDHWDLMTLEVLGSYGEWFDPEHPTRQTLDQAWRDHLDRLSAFRSEWFAFGPEAAKVAAGINEKGLYHVEMFRALAGHKYKLLQQRAMENRYLRETQQVANLVFKGDQGSDWDVMTIGFHDSMQSFATGSPLSPEQKNTIARKVGFASVDDIGPYLRSLIQSHNDTLAVPVR